MVHFDPSLPWGTACDAFSIGIGANLFHRNFAQNCQNLGFKSNSKMRTWNNTAKFIGKKNNSTTNSL